MKKEKQCGRKKNKRTKMGQNKETKKTIKGQRK